jgi:hypothetical protein
MQLSHINIAKSPSNDGRVRLSGKVAYDDKTIKPEIYWFDVPEKYAEFLSSSGSPWLVCLLPLALTLGEPLRICAPVDRVLLQGVQELMRIWKCWYPHLHVVPIEAEMVDTKPQEASGRTASFFSGGVDSFFTILRHQNGNSDSFPETHIDDLLCIWGFDIPLRNTDAFRRMRETLQRAASDLGNELIDIATNLRETRFRQSDWGHLSHGCALASVALVLERRYSKVLLASSYGYKYLKPWGSHPLTDPLLSTARTEIFHDGAAFDRVEKTEFIAKSEIAMRTLRVCWKSYSDENCCACDKCYRTMTTLALLGALDRCTTLRCRSFDIRKIPRIYLPAETDRIFFREVQALALQKRRLDVARDIDRSFKHSARLKVLLSITRSLKTKRFIRRWARSSIGTCVTGAFNRLTKQENL